MAEKRRRKRPERGGSSGRGAAKGRGSEKEGGCARRQQLEKGQLLAGAGAFGRGDANRAVVLFAGFKFITGGAKSSAADLTTPVRGRERRRKGTNRRR